MFRLMGSAPVFVTLVLIMLSATLGADELVAGSFTPVDSGVRYRSISVFDVERLNKILTKERKAFADFDQEFPPARFPVRLYQVLYSSVVPEWNNRPTTGSGLIAIPQTGQDEMPVVSYQHGTTFKKKEVPSNPEESYETRLMVAQFAGQGYVVIGADYFGKGESPEPDSYTVKASTQQACLDMLLASRDVCRELKIKQGPLFLSGWSQGGWSTMTFLNKLESLAIPVTAAATASAFNDVFATTNRWIHVPQVIDAVWLPGDMAIQLHAYEEYYGLPGLGSSAIEPPYQEAARALYDKRITYDEFRARSPSSIGKFLREGFRSASSAGEGRYWQILQDNQAYRWRSRTPLRTYFGDIDEACPASIATFPVGYQKLVGGGQTTGEAAGAKADHRGTFLYAVAHQKSWFDELLRPK